MYPLLRKLITSTRSQSGMDPDPDSVLLLVFCKLHMRPCPLCQTPPPFRAYSNAQILSQLRHIDHIHVTSQAFHVHSNTSGRFWCTAAT